MTPVTIKSLKPGSFFYLKNDENSPLYVRDEYNRSTRKYEAHKYYDTCSFREFKGDKIVFVD